MRQDIDKIWEILVRHEKRLKEINVQRMLSKIFKRKNRWEKQKDRYFGIHLALCVDTRDPWKQNRVRYFSPVLDIPIDNGGANVGGQQRFTTTVDQLKWANPISSMGGFDDSGLCWVPPAGSTICILFQNANPNNAFYVGTTWVRERGPIGTDGEWNYPMPEFMKIFRGHRKGFMVGKNDESQNLPPWNTENYQGFDYDNDADLDLIPDASTKTTWPHMYGFKTPEKHRLTMDDGDPKCNRRYKRLEIQSSMGHYFLMKDDPYHYCGEWSNPKCNQAFISIVPDICSVSFLEVPDIEYGQVRQIPLIYPCEQGPDNCPTSPETVDGPAELEYLGREFLCSFINPPSTITTMPVDCLSVLNRIPDWCHNFNNTGRNKYQKHKQECYPFLCGKCALIQSGIQLLSRSGHSFVMDDSVEEPRKRPEWERALEEFDYDGCTGNFKGRTYWESATGHFIEMNDTENQPKIRSISNGINIQSATGNQICLNDHSIVGDILEDGRTLQYAGDMRGIHMKSTSNHELTFCDAGNKQGSGERHGCTQTGPWANKAFIKLRSGYGLQLTMSDAHDQKKTDQQYIQLLSPQTDNTERGPHMIHMQEKATGPGQVFVRAGGDYIIQTYDQMVEVVGDEKDNPSNKLEFISKQKIISVKDVYYNKAKTHVFWADDYIFLLAGKDCPVDNVDDQGHYDGTTTEGTCVYPVVVATTQIPEWFTAQTGLKASEHVFASARNAALPCDLVGSDLLNNELISG